MRNLLVALAGFAAHAHAEWAPNADTCHNTNAKGQDHAWFASTSQCFVFNEDAPLCNNGSNVVKNCNEYFQTMDCPTAD